jgi:acyl carrier protein
MDETFEQRCLHIFREVAGLQYAEIISSFSDSRLLGEPIAAMNIDSLTRLEFVMKIESAFDVELDEAAVNECRTIREFAALLAAASK